jgi:hypothetical protein
MAEDQIKACLLLNKRTGKRTSITLNMAVINQQIALLRYGKALFSKSVYQ